MNMRKIITNHYRCSCGRSVVVESAPLPTGEWTPGDIDERSAFFARTQAAVTEAHEHQKSCTGTPTNTTTMRDAQ